MKPKYVIVYGSLFWEHRGGYACTGLHALPPVSTKAEARKLLKKTAKETSDLLICIDLETGNEVVL